MPINGRRPLPFVFLLISALVAASSRDAFALDGVDLEIAAKEGYGSNPTQSSANPLRLGFGARAGVAVSGWYAGLTVVDYVGETSDSGAHGHAYLYGLEGGYGFQLDERFALRPMLGVGRITESVSLNSAWGAWDSQFPPDGFTRDYFYFEPGVTGLVAIGRGFLGLDANVLIVPGAGPDGGKWLAGTLHAQVGVKL